MCEQNNQITYEDSGVSIKAGAEAVDLIGDSVKSTARPEVIGDIGGFGGLFSAAAFKGMDDPILVSGTDGVGTKIRLAQLLRDSSTVGIDLVAMCANDVVVCGAEPLFFLDYIAIGKLEPEFVSTVVAGVAEGCKQAGCALIGGEMAEHPGVMDPDDYDLSGFCVGVVDRPKMIGPDKVKPGDVIIGLASSGLHSNGFSLVRRAMVERMDLAVLTAPCEQLGGRSVGATLLEPTRIYVKPLLAALRAGLDIHACAHITGGGITENLDRALPSGTVAKLRRGSWPVPEIIQMVCSAASLSAEEAYKTFNMGIGMCVICPQEAVYALISHFESAGEKAFVVGEIVAGEDSNAKAYVEYIDAL